MIPKNIVKKMLEERNENPKSQYSKAFKDQSKTAMTVKDLINQLNTLDPNSVVTLTIYTHIDNEKFTMTSYNELLLEVQESFDEYNTCELIGMCPDVFEKYQKQIEDNN